MTRDRILTLLMYAALCTVGTTAVVLAGAFAAWATSPPDAPQSTPQADVAVSSTDASPQPSWAQGASGTTRFSVGGVPVVDVAVKGKKVPTVTAPMKPDPDPLQKHCRAMLNGSLGRQATWKMRAARYAVATGQTADRTVWNTTFCPKCDNSGVCFDGTKLRDGICAANPEIPLHRVIWTADFGFAVVSDRGQHVKLRYAHGRQLNIDSYIAGGCPGGCNAGNGQTPATIGAILGDVTTVCGMPANRIGGK